MKGLKKAFNIGSSSGGNDDAGKLIDQSESSGARSSDKPGGFWRTLVEDAEKAKARDQIIVRNEIQDIQGTIHRAKTRTNDINEKGTYDENSIKTLIRQINEVKTWIDEHKKALDLPKQDYEEMRKEYLNARKALERYQTQMSVRSLSMGINAMMTGNETHLPTPQEADPLKQEVVNSAITFLTRAQTKLASWSSQDNSQSQPVDNPPLSTSHHSHSEDDLGAPQEDPFM